MDNVGPGIAKNKVGILSERTMKKKKKSLILKKISGSVFVLAQ